MPNELNLNGKVEVLVVTIGDEKYSIPLAADLPYKKTKPLMKMATKWKNIDLRQGMNEEELDNIMDVFFEFFKQYIPLEVLEELSSKSLMALANAWVGANSTEDDGQTLGES